MIHTMRPVLFITAAVLSSSILVGAQQRAGRTVQGTVFDYTGAQVGDATVTYRGNSIRTNNDGDFALSVTDSGILTVSAEGYATAKQRIPLGGDWLVFELVRPSTITGSVVDWRTDEPISDSIISVFVKTPTRLVSSGGRTVDGVLKVDDLPAGRAMVIGRATGFAPALTEFGVKAGGEYPLELALFREATIFGRVAYETGQSADGALVRVTYGPEVHGGEYLAGLIHGTTIVDDGEFWMSGLLPDTPIYVHAEHGDVRSIAHSFMLRPGEERRAITIALGP